MSDKEKRIRAVLGKNELRLPSLSTAKMLMVDGVLFEGWETYYEISFGVMPGYDLNDVQEWLDTGKISKAHFIPYGPLHYDAVMNDA